jgi:hypothetical protein
MGFCGKYNVRRLHGLILKVHHGLQPLLSQLLYVLIMPYLNHFNSKYCYLNTVHKIVAKFSIVLHGWHENNLFAI